MNRPVAPRTTLLLVLLAAVLPWGCAATGPDPKWVQDEIPATTDAILWDVTKLSMQKAGFNVLNDLDPVKRVATSGWRQDLAPFRKRGFREQAVVKYSSSKEGRIDLEVRVRRELNMDIVKPLDPTYADWKPDQDNEARAKIILQYIKAYLGERIEVGEKPDPFNRDGN